MGKDCSACQEPTKRVTGFWDGYDRNGRPTCGNLYACGNADCPERRAQASLEQAEQKRRKHAEELNSARGIDPKKIRADRIARRLTIRDMAERLGCSSADYSSYETGREAFPDAALEAVRALLNIEGVEEDA